MYQTHHIHNHPSTTSPINKQHTITYYRAERWSGIRLYAAILFTLFVFAGLISCGVMMDLVLTATLCQLGIVIFCAVIPIGWIYHTTERMRREAE